MLQLFSPWRGTGWGETWTFSGKDGEVVRDCCMQLDSFAVDDHADHWNAVVVLSWIDFPEQPAGNGPAPPVAGAWNIAGALRLAELLPETLADVRGALVDRFTNLRSDSPRLP